MVTFGAAAGAAVGLYQHSAEVARARGSSDEYAEAARAEWSQKSVRRAFIRTITLAARLAGNEELTEAIKQQSLQDSMSIRKLMDLPLNLMPPMGQNTLTEAVRHYDYSKTDIKRMERYNYDHFARGPITKNFLLVSDSVLSIKTGGKTRKSRTEKFVGYVKELGVKRGYSLEGQSVYPGAQVRRIATELAILMCKRANVTFVEEMLQHPRMIPQYDGFVVCVWCCNDACARGGANQAKDPSQVNINNAAVLCGVLSRAVDAICIGPGRSAQWSLPRQWDVTAQKCMQSLNDAGVLRAPGSSWFSQCVARDTFHFAANQGTYESLGDMIITSVNFLRHQLVLRLLSHYAASAAGATRADAERQETSSSSDPDDEEAAATADAKEFLEPLPTLPADPRSLEEKMASRRASELMLQNAPTTIEDAPITPRDLAEARRATIMKSTVEAYDEDSAEATRADLEQDVDGANPNVVDLTNIEDGPNDVIRAFNERYEGRALKVLEKCFDLNLWNVRGSSYEVGIDQAMREFRTAHSIADVCQGEGMQWYTMTAMKQPKFVMQYERALSKAASKVLRQRGDAPRRQQNGHRHIPSRVAGNHQCDRGGKR